MTRDQANGLIERLADKTLSFGVYVETGDRKVRYCGNERFSGNHYEVYEDTGDLYEYDLETCGDIKILGHPIMLTDVLEKIQQFHAEPEKAPPYIECGMDTQNAQHYIQDLWCNCGFTKSLQDILAEAEWDDYWWQTDVPVRAGPLMTNLYSMKDPAAKLFEYLLSLFPET